MELFDQIGNIELKVRQLVKKLERLNSNNKDLLEENQVLKEALHSQEANHKIFKEKILNIKGRFEEEMDQEVDKTSLYLREIQQCVDWLEEQ